MKKRIEISFYDFELEAIDEAAKKNGRNRKNWIEFIILKEVSELL